VSPLSRAAETADLLGDGPEFTVAHGALIRVTLGLVTGRALPSTDNTVLNLAHHHAVEGWLLEYLNGEPIMADAEVWPFRTAGPAHITVGRSGPPPCAARASS
jgi:hypothetical protein